MDLGILVTLVLVVLGLGALHSSTQALRSLSRWNRRRDHSRLWMLSPNARKYLMDGRNDEPL
jgi:hypothetical protein